MQSYAYCLQVRLIPLLVVASTIFGASVAKAQTLPPIPDLQVQLTANAGISTTVDGAGISDWFDQAHGHLFFNANALLPTYVADSGSGVPAIDFARSSGFVGDFSSTAGSTIGDATIFVVARFDGYTHAPGSSSYFYSIDNFASPGVPNASEHTLGRDAGNLGPNQLYHWRAQPAPPDAYGTNIIEDRAGQPFGNFNNYTAIFRGTDDGGGPLNEMEAWINGSAGGTDTPDVTHNGSGYNAAPSETRVGLWTSNGSGLDGMIRELLIYNRILSSSEITAVEAYLAERSEVTISPTMLLQVNRETGVASLKNVSGAPLQISGYSITSDAEALHRLNWTSIARNYDQDDGGEVDAVHHWNELGQPSDFDLREAAASGFATLALNQEVLLGSVWSRYFLEDLSLEFTDGTGSLVFGQVQFSGNSGEPYEYGDLNFDGEIDTDDWTHLRNVYGNDLTGTSTAAAYALGDLTNDGKHSLQDIQAFRDAFVAAGGSLASLTVPEPCSGALLLLGALPAVILCFRGQSRCRCVRDASRLAVAGVCAIVVTTSMSAHAALFDDVVGLSNDAKSKLLIHFDGRIGVTTGAGNSVTAWEGRDGNGNPVATATVMGTGNPSNITHAADAVVLNELVAAETLHLAAPLVHPANGNWTIFWFGHYDSGNQNGAASAGIYTYNLTDLANDSSGFNQQRDDGTGGVWNGEIFTGGDGNDGAATSIYGPIGQFDDVNTVWRNVHTDDGSAGYTSTLFAEGGQIGTIARGRTLPANSTLLIGAYDDGQRFNGSGYNHLGEIQHLIVFKGVLSPSDNAAIESYIGPDLPTLRVNTATAELTLTGGEVMRNINAYEVRSPGNSLNPAAWLSTNLDARNVDATSAAVGGSWDTFDAASSRLTEAYLLSSSQFSSSRTESLGFGYNATVGARDLEFEYTSTDGITRAGVVEYSTPPGLVGDFNHNGIVDAADYVLWRKTLNAIGEGLPADANGDGVVNAADYNLWRANFGRSAAVSAASLSAQSIPEPGAIVLLSIGLLLSGNVHNGRKTDGWKMPRGRPNQGRM